MTKETAVEVQNKKKYVPKQSKKKIEKEELKIIFIKDSSVIAQNKAGFNTRIQKGDLPKNIKIEIGAKIKI